MKNILTALLALSCFISLLEVQTIAPFKDSDGWLKGRRDIFPKAVLREVKESRQNQMDMLISTIYEVNRPVSRRITLTLTK